MSGGLWPKIMLIGHNGQIGWELNRTLITLGQIITVDYPEIDLAKPDTIIRWVRETKPDLIVNAAAYTAVDKAEDEPDLALAINGAAPGILAEETKKMGAFLVHYSTDYVFDGTKGSPYTEEDEPNPLNVYGKTKLAGERAIQAVGCDHMILRTSWVYGLRGKNFLLTILRLARERDEIRVVDDQVGTPNWSRWIAQATAHILAEGQESVRGKAGLYHLSASGETSWYGFAGEIMELSGKNVISFLPIKSSEYKSKTIRPFYSVLANKKMQDEFEIHSYSWHHYLKQLFQTV